MSDDWEDDDFVPTLNSAPLVKAGEEEDLLAKEIVAPVVSKITEEQKAKKIAEDEAAFQKKMSAAKISEETADQKKRRERLQVEEADHALTNELFDGQARPTPAVTGPATTTATVASNSARNFSSKPAAGLGSIPISNKQDHFEFGNLVSIKLQDSTPMSVAAFYKGLAKVVKPSTFSVDVLEEIIVELQKIKETKAPKVVGKKGEPVKKTAAEIKKEKQRHKDIFGDDFDTKEGKYDHLAAMEDDFM